MIDLIFIEHILSLCVTYHFFWIAILSPTVVSDKDS